VGAPWMRCLKDCTMEQICERHFEGKQKTCWRLINFSPVLSVRRSIHGDQSKQVALPFICGQELADKPLRNDSIKNRLLIILILNLAFNPRFQSEAPK